jgi:hypothetical protein
MGVTDLRHGALPSKQRGDRDGAFDPGAPPAVPR